MTQTRIRPPTQAGRFYPSNPNELLQLIDSLLEDNPFDPKLCGLPLALIVPHAGYAYSGPTAAKAYACLRGRKISRVILIGPSHYTDFPNIGFYSGDGMATPLGTVPFDNLFLDQLRKRLNMMALPVESETSEHSLEVQLPFLQRTLGEFSVVPLLMRKQTSAEVSLLSEALVDLIQGPEVAQTLLVASSDLYHGYDEAEAEVEDRIVQQALLALDVEGLLESASARRCMACGMGAIATVMSVARAMGYSSPAVISRTNSSRVVSSSGGYVVGYLSAVLS